MTPDQHGYVKCESCGCWRPVEETCPLLEKAPDVRWCKDGAFCVMARNGVKL